MQIQKYAIILTTISFIMRILSDVIVHLTGYWICRRRCCLRPIRKENECQKIENKPFCNCKTCSDSIQMIYVLFKYGLVLSTLLCIVRSNVAVMWLMVAISINFHRHICYITTMVTQNPCIYLPVEYSTILILKAFFRNRVSEGVIVAQHQFFSYINAITS